MEGYAVVVSFEVLVAIGVTVWIGFISVFAALGGNAMNATPPDFVVARWLFSFAFLILIAGIVASLLLFFLPEQRLRLWQPLLGIYCMVFAVTGASWFGTLAWADQREANFSDSQLLAEKIKVYLDHADWFSYLEATSTIDNRWRRIVPSAPLQVAFQKGKKVEFSFGIANDNTKASIEKGARLFLIVDPEYKLEVIPDDRDKSRAKWQVGAGGEQFWYLFQEAIPSGGQHHAGNFLCVKFPHPGLYIFKFQISGPGIPQMRDTELKVRVGEFSHHDAIKS